MKGRQLALDVAVRPSPGLDRFCGPAAPPLFQILKHWFQSLPGLDADFFQKSGLQGWGCSAGPSPWAPVYLWGPEGCGKTHVLAAVADHLRQAGRVCAWLDALQPLPVEPWVDVWSAVLLDDVHALDAAGQQQAFSWFAQAAALGVPVLAAGRLPPTDLPLREDLRTRLGWGPVLHLPPLDDDGLRVLLAQSAHDRGLRLPPEVTHFVLHRFSRDPGSLMALLDALDDYALQTQRAITIPLVKSMLENA